MIFNKEESNLKVMLVKKTWNRIDIDKDILVQKYLNEKKTAQIIAQELNTTSAVIFGNLKRSGYILWKSVI